MTAEHVSRETRSYLTSTEAAYVLGVDGATIRKWVERGHLTPMNPGEKPLRFRTFDVWQCGRARLSQRERARLHAGWFSILTTLDDPVDP